MLKAISKAAFRVRSVDTAISTLKLAVQTALTAPAGPVSVEIPIDIQSALINLPADLSPLPVPVARPSEQALDDLAERFAQARRPMLWLGRCPACRPAGTTPAGHGRGRGHQHPGAWHRPGRRHAFPRRLQPEQTGGAVLPELRRHARGGLAPARQRNPQVRTQAPRPLYRADADATAEGRCYPSDFFVCGDSERVLKGLADRLEGRLSVDPAFAADLAAARNQARAQLVDGLGPYASLVEQLQALAGRNFNWVRDVTVSNSTWGNRHLNIFSPRAGVHALGGGIGQGLAMGIGAAVGAAETAPGRKTFVLAGDGGFILNLGELATAVQERADMLIVLMNDQGYGVIKNIQDAAYGGRRCYVDLHTRTTPNCRLPSACVMPRSAI